MNLIDDVTQNILNQSKCSVGIAFVSSSEVGVDLRARSTFRDRVQLRASLRPHRRVHHQNVSKDDGPRGADSVRTDGISESHLAHPKSEKEQNL